MSYYIHPLASLFLDAIYLPRPVTLPQTLVLDWQPQPSQQLPTMDHFVGCSWTKRSYTRLYISLFCFHTYQSMVYLVTLGLSAKMFR